MQSGRADLASALEVNSTSNGSVATYKSLSEDNSHLEEKNQEQPIAMGKIDDVEIDDGAKEKMLNDPSSMETSTKASEVIFISENGDAKIDIKSTNQILAGMGKEELMKYANDPFWVRLRWIMFIGFWILWFAMLIGAVAIIVFAPKCTAPQPKKWWEKSPIVQIDATEIDGKSLDKIEMLLKDLQGEHIHTISLTSFLQGTPGHVEDFKVIKRELGNAQSVVDIISKANERDQKVVLEFDPNHSSIKHPWFERSVKREDPYTNYYVWADGKTDSDSGTRQPPNNWLSVYGGSAWTWNNERGQYYLHQLDKTQPDFNFHNQNVIDEFVEIFQFWLARGISGFRLGSIQFLTEDPSRRNEQRSTKPALADEYDYLNHVYTQNYGDNAHVLKLWRDAIANITKGDELFAMQDEINADALAVLNQNQSLIDLPQKPQFLSIADAEMTAETLRGHIANWTKLPNVSWAGWDVNGKDRPLKKRMPGPVTDSFTLMTLFLPGTPIFKLNDTRSAGKAFGTLAAKRSEETFLYGDFKSYIINGTVFVYTRLKAGYPGYLVAYQTSRQNAVIDISTLPNMPLEVNVLAYSLNYIQNDESVVTKLPSNKVPISAKSTLVITYVPES